MPKQSAAAPESPAKCSGGLHNTPVQYAAVTNAQSLQQYLVPETTCLTIHSKRRGHVLSNTLWDSQAWKPQGMPAMG